MYCNAVNKLKDLQAQDMPRPHSRSGKNASSSPCTHVLPRVAEVACGDRDTAVVAAHRGGHGATVTAGAAAVTVSAGAVTAAVAVLRAVPCPLYPAVGAGQAVVVAAAAAAL